MLIVTVHEASLVTLFNPIWEHNGARIHTITNPFTNESKRLPVSSFDEQLLAPLLRGAGESICSGVYSVIISDEVDCSHYPLPLPLP